MNRLRQTLAQQQSDLKYFLNWYEVSRSHHLLSNATWDFMKFVTGSWWGEAAAQVVSSPRWWSASEGQSAASLSSAWASCFTRRRRWGGQEYWEDEQQDSPLNLIKRWSLGRAQSWWTIDCQFIWVFLAYPLLIIFNPSTLDYLLTNSFPTNLSISRPPESANRALFFMASDIGTCHLDLVFTIIFNISDIKSANVGGVRKWFSHTLNRSTATNRIALNIVHCSNRPYFPPIHHNIHNLNTIFQWFTIILAYPYALWMLK